MHMILTDAAAAHNRTQIIVSRHLPSAHSVSHAMRSQFDSKERAPLSTGFELGGWSLTSSHSRYTETTTDTKTSSGRMYSDDRESQGRRSGATGSNSELELGVHVQVQIEETVTVEYDPEAFVRESCRTPRVLWGEDAARGGRPHTADSRREQDTEERGDASQSYLSDRGAAGT